MAVVKLNNMAFYAHHGCFEQERTIGTRFRIDLRYETDSSQAELSDDISHTVSYLDVYQIVKHQMQQPSHLLEHVGHRIGEQILLTFDAIDWVEVSVSKLAPPLGGQLESVSVKIKVQR